MAARSSRQGRPKPRRSPLPLIAGSVGGVIATTIAALGGWIGYSALAVEHAVPLPPALDAEQRTFNSPTCGTLSYYADRRAGGRPLVLIHSINAAAAAFEMRPVFDHFRAARPVYALDLPGFGFSDRDDRDYTPQLYTRAIVEFVEREVGDDADLIAFSLSSEFAARAALDRPDLFRSLAMISPSGFQQRGSENSVQATGASGASERVLRVLKWRAWSQALYDLLATRTSIHYFLQRNFVGPVPPDLEEYAYLTTHQPGARFAPLAFVSGKLFTPDIRAAVYEKLQAPVLVLYDEDPNVRFDALPQMLQRPNWRGARIRPTKGLPHWEKLPETAAALEQFWGEAARKTIRE